MNKDHLDVCSNEHTNELKLSTHNRDMVNKNIEAVNKSESEKIKYCEICNTHYLIKCDSCIFKKRLSLN